jgi:hypothetical protein
MSAPLNMKRRLFLALAVAAVAAFPAAAAAGFEDALLGQLRGLGFSKISVEHTLLGRTRLVAERADGTREIILNPRTGEILRDLWTAADGSSGSGGLIDNSGSGSDSSGSDGSGDDEGGDDNSGSGSSGSGSGSGSSGSGGGGGGNSGEGGGGEGEGGDGDDD